ncbi:hypothetical protein IAD21_04496 [Abditibacteriota bacterium]|nr:hypothetical protein IAD21_04496 [Abditibacteriota bacterium]
MKSLDKAKHLYRICWALSVLSLVLLSRSEPLLAQNAGARPAPPHKLALLVGISNYSRGRDANRDWWNLHSEADMAAMKQVLVQRFGFADKDVVVLTDAKATRQGIIAAFQKQLIARAHPGDVVLFHYSGHGQQVPDPGKRKLNGMRQGLVPFDYISQKASDGVKSNLQDDNVRDLLSQLKAKMAGPDGKVQGNITVFLDSCFSGTAPLGENGLPQRGRGWNEKIDGPRPQMVAAPATPQSETPAGSGMLEPGEAMTNGYVVISAARSDQTAQEARDEKGRPIGALTYYLTRALQQATPQTTYRTLFEKMTLQLQETLPDQTPQMEGEADKLLFAGAALPVQSFLVVQKANKNTLTLPVGFLQGTSVGSRYAIYKPNSDVGDANNLIGEADITSVEDIHSQAQLTSESADKLKAEDLQSARVVETAHNFGENRLRVLFEGNGPWVDAIKASQARGELDVMTTEGATATNYDVLIRLSNGKLAMLRRGGQPLALIINDEHAPAKVRDALMGEWRWRYLARLGTSNAASLLQLEMKLVRVNNAVGEAPVDTDGGMVFHYGDTYALQLRNLSPVNAYVTVLDLSPDGTINPVLPPGNIVDDALKPTPPEYIPADGAWHQIQGFSWGAAPPAGREIWKVIATREPADFSSFLLQKTETEGGEVLYPALLDLTKRGAPPNPLEKLLLRSQTGTHRGFTAVPPSYWTTAQVSFEVKP